MPVPAFVTISTGAGSIVVVADGDSDALAITHRRANARTCSLRPHRSDSSPRLSTIAGPALHHANRRYSLEYVLFCL